MGGLAKIVGTLLVGILSAALAVIFQNDIAAFFGRAPITAEVTIGSWYPHFNSENRQLYRPQDEEVIGTYADPEDANFARIKISNKSGKDIPHIYFVSEPSWGDSSWVQYDAVVIRESSKTLVRDVHSKAKSRIDLGALPAASTIVVYVWSNRTFSYPFGMDDIKLVSTEGEIVKTVNRLSGDATSFVFGIHTEYIAWGLLALTLVIGGILIFGLSQQWAFVKALLTSDDYYLEQRQRFENNPKKFTLPDKIPSSPDVP